MLKISINQPAKQSATQPTSHPSSQPTNKPTKQITVRKLRNKQPGTGGLAHSEEVAIKPEYLSSDPQHPVKAVHGSPDCRNFFKGLFQDEKCRRQCQQLNLKSLLETMQVRKGKRK